MSETIPHHDTLTQIITQTQKVIHGKEEQIKLSLAAFLAGGHLLLEDLPGVGKTTLAKTLARAMGMEYRRLQFTSDLLPSDILGVTYFDTKQGGFAFKKGPIFASFLLVDEINRAMPKTQSALLEAMAEHQVSIDGTTHALPEPFFVLATKNPFEEIGTFELPHSQLDRFIASLSLGYPDAHAEREIFLKTDSGLSEQIESASPDILLKLRSHCQNVHLAEPILDYLQSLVGFTRQSGLFRFGFSTRGALALANLSRGWALVEGRMFVIPDDIQHVLPFVMRHRFLTQQGRSIKQEMIDEVLASTPLPE